jgi:hypothetical protein
MRPTILSASIALALCLVGFFTFWEVTLVGIMYALLFGNYAVAIVLAVFADILFGAPTSAWLHFLPLPLTLFALAGTAARIFLLRQMRGGLPTRL